MFFIYTIAFISWKKKQIWNFIISKFRNSYIYLFFRKLDIQELWEFSWSVTWICITVETILNFPVSLRSLTMKNIKALLVKMFNAIDVCPSYKLEILLYTLSLYI